MKRNQSGFTLLEVMIAVVVATLIAVAMLPNYPDIVNQKRADVTVARMLTLSEAAQAYITATTNWPDQANDCADALNVLTTGGYINGVGATSPWQTNYSFACPVGAGGIRVFSVGVDSVLDDWAQYMVNSLPASTMTAAAGTPAVRTVTGSFPPPSTLTGAAAIDLNDVLWRTDQSGGPNPERNRMDYEIDMNSNDIRNAGEIEWANSKLTTQDGGSIELGSRTGGPGSGNPRIDFHVAGGVGGPSGDMRIIASAPDLLEFAGGRVVAEDMIIRDSGNHLASEGIYRVALVGPEEVVTKPACGAGLDPSIYVALAEFAETSDTSGADEILGVKVQAEDGPATGTWTIHFFVTTFEGTILPADVDPAVNKAIALIKCSA